MSIARGIRKIICWIKGHDGDKIQIRIDDYDYLDAIVYASRIQKCNRCHTTKILDTMVGADPA